MKNQTKTTKKEKSVIASGAANGAWSTLCTLLAAAVISAFLLKSGDPARNIFAISLVCSGIGGFLCALFSFLNCKNDVLLCSAVSGLVFCLAVSLGSLLFDNTGKGYIERVLPLCIILVSSVVFGLLFKGAGKKKRHSLR